LPSPSDLPSPNATDGSSCSTNPCPATPPPLPQYIAAQLLPPEGEMLPNHYWQWESHPIKIPPSQSVHHVRHPQIQNSSLSPHDPALLPTFITQSYSSRSRSVQNSYKAQQVQNSYLMETVPWPPPSHRTIAVTTDLPAPYPSSATQSTTFTAYRGTESVYSNPPIPRIEEPRSISQASFRVRGGM
jgi:hypothetical protein